MASAPLAISDGRTRGDKARVILLVLGVIVVLSSLAFGSFGVYDSNTTSHAALNNSKEVLIAQAHNHTSTIKLDNRIKALVKQETILTARLLAATKDNHALGLSNNALATQIEADSATVSKDAGIVAQQNAAICSALGISSAMCPGAP